MNITKEEIYRKRYEDEQKSKRERKIWEDWNRWGDAWRNMTGAPFKRGNDEDQEE